MVRTSAGSGSLSLASTSMSSWPAGVFSAALSLVATGAVFTATAAAEELLPEVESVPSPETDAVAVDGSGAAAGNVAVKLTTRLAPLARVDNGQVRVVPTVEQVAPPTLT